ncbi:MAG: PHP domain protein [Candidatus Woesebacteria bacterium GW2011_GWA1_37_8]|uniref:DNA-directed DNA polymerase n=2 Tax=Candidatus Woeseibacteriota TaxID=1752722 RepID=A0A0G0NNA0_9BACT|nr:MAG: PHP domain protein [Microgenomates group bacterium GW2011_GWC1_37_12b]KKQ45729.1 MAG: PHP domain protein [Candidatus Woesebacteria bacterium GW2011_GWA1_37_8]KKQ87379.1 MAG: PHP domain protein [Candidatus Woesebacteria bacterium GW2011_GWB1_38_8b]
MKKDINNLEIADLLRSVASAYEIKDKDKNKFRIIAYERAADAIEHLSSEAKDLYDDNKLDEIPGVGKSISENLSEIFLNGKSKHFKDVFRGIDSSVYELIKLPGIGPKTADKLSKAFKIDKKDPIKSLLRYAKKGEISKLSDFGVESEKEIINAINDFKGTSTRHLLNYAIEISDQIVDWMKREAVCETVEVLGSLRRKASTVGDIDIAVATKDKKKSIMHFTDYPNKSRIVEKGETSASILLPSGVQVDLITQNPSSFGALLQHFTGSKHHNIKLREFALKKGLSLSEKGIKTLKKSVPNFRLENKNYNSKLKIYEYKTERDFYNALGMDWIPPEIREDNGEIEASQRSAQGKLPGLPKLVNIGDVKADLQIHSDFNVETSHDLGLSSIEEIIAKANDLGYEYIALTEHNPSQKGHSDNDIIEILKKKKYIVEQINNTLTNNQRVKHVFNSLEIDIVPDGRLPVPDKCLELLDFALVSIHSSFRLKKAEMTKRVMSALENPRVRIFAHPTGRKLNEREGVELDWDKIFDFALKYNKWIEINADPMRLDLPDYLVKDAVKYGVKLTLGTDAHHIDHMDNMIYGIYTARRGWAEKNNIVNTLTFDEFKKVLE